MTWPIKNPCDECYVKYINQDIKCDRVCEKRSHYQSQLAGAKAALKYVIHKINECKEPVTLVTLKDMLKELEEKLK